MISLQLKGMHLFWVALSLLILETSHGQALNNLQVKIKAEALQPVNPNAIGPQTSSFRKKSSIVQIEQYARKLTQTIFQNNSKQITKSFEKIFDSLKKNEIVGDEGPKNIKLLLQKVHPEWVKSPQWNSALEQAQKETKMSLLELKLKFFQPIFIREFLIQVVNNLKSTPYFKHFFPNLYAAISNKSMSENLIDNEINKLINLIKSLFLKFNFTEYTSDQREIRRQITNEKNRNFNLVVNRSIKIFRDHKHAIEEKQKLNALIKSINLPKEKNHQNHLLFMINQIKDCSVIKLTATKILEQKIDLIIRNQTEKLFERINGIPGAGVKSSILLETHSWHSHKEHIDKNILSDFNLITPEEIKKSIRSLVKKSIMKFQDNDSIKNEIYVILKKKITNEAKQLIQYLKLLKKVKIGTVDWIRLSRLQLQKSQNRKLALANWILANELIKNEPIFCKKLKSIPVSAEPNQSCENEFKALQRLNQPRLKNFFASIFPVIKPTFNKNERNNYSTKVAQQKENNPDENPGEILKLDILAKKILEKPAILKKMIQRLPPHLQKELTHYFQTNPFSRDGWKHIYLKIRSQLADYYHLSHTIIKKINNTVEKHGHINTNIQSSEVDKIIQRFTPYGIPKSVITNRWKEIQNAFEEGHRTALKLRARVHFWSDRKAITKQDKLSIKNSPLGEARAQLVWDWEVLFQKNRKNSYLRLFAYLEDKPKLIYTNIPKEDSPYLSKNDFNKIKEAWAKKAIHLYIKKMRNLGKSAKKIEGLLVDHQNGLPEKLIIAVRTLGNNKTADLFTLPLYAHEEIQVLIKKAYSLGFSGSPFMTKRFIRKNSESTQSYLKKLSFNNLRKILKDAYDAGMSSRPIPKSWPENLLDSLVKVAQTSANITIGNILYYGDKAVRSTPALITILSPTPPRYVDSNLTNLKNSWKNGGDTGVNFLLMTHRLARIYGSSAFDLNDTPFEKSVTDIEKDILNAMPIFHASDAVGHLLDGAHEGYVFYARQVNNLTRKEYEEALKNSPWLKAGEASFYISQAAVGLLLTSLTGDPSKARDLILSHAMVSGLISGVGSLGSELYEKGRTGRSFRYGSFLKGWAKSFSGSTFFSGSMTPLKLGKKSAVIVPILDGIDSSSEFKTTYHMYKNSKNLTQDIGTALVGLSAIFDATNIKAADSIANKTTSPGHNPFPSLKQYLKNKIANGFDLNSVDQELIDQSRKLIEDLKKENLTIPIDRILKIQKLISPVLPRMINASDIIGIEQAHRVGNGFPYTKDENFKKGIILRRTFKDIPTDLRKKIIETLMKNKIVGENQIDKLEFGNHDERLRASWNILRALGENKKFEDEGELITALIKVINNGEGLHITVNSIMALGFLLKENQGPIHNIIEQAKYHKYFEVQEAAHFVLQNYKKMQKDAANNVLKFSNSPNHFQEHIPLEVSPNIPTIDTLIKKYNLDKKEDRLKFAKLHDQNPRIYKILEKAKNSNDFSHSSFAKNALAYLYADLSKDPLFKGYLKTGGEKALKEIFSKMGAIQLENICKVGCCFCGFTHNKKFLSGKYRQFPTETLRSIFRRFGPNSNLFMLYYESDPINLDIPILEGHSSDRYHYGNIHILYRLYESPAPYLHHLLSSLGYKKTTHPQRIYVSTIVPKGKEDLAIHLVKKGLVNRISFPDIDTRRFQNKKNHQKDALEKVKEFMEKKKLALNQGSQPGESVDDKFILGRKTFIPNIEIRPIGKKSEAITKNNYKAGIGCFNGTLLTPEGIFNVLQVPQRFNNVSDLQFVIRVSANFQRNPLPRGKIKLEALLSKGILDFNYAQGGFLNSDFDVQEVPHFTIKNPLTGEIAGYSLLVDEQGMAHYRGSVLEKDIIMPNEFEHELKEIFKKKSAKERNALISRLLKRAVKSKPVWTPNYSFPYRAIKNVLMSKDIEDQEIIKQVYDFLISFHFHDASLLLVDIYRSKLLNNNKFPNLLIDKKFILEEIVNKGKLINYILTPKLDSKLREMELERLAKMLNNDFKNTSLSHKDVLKRIETLQQKNKNMPNINSVFLKALKDELKK